MKELTLRVPFSPKEPDYLDGDDAKIMHLFRIFFSEEKEGSQTSRLGLGILKRQFDKMSESDVKNMEDEVSRFITRTIPELSQVNISLRPVANTSNPNVIDVLAILSFVTSQSNIADVIATKYFGATFVNSGEKVEKTYRFLLSLSSSSSISVTIYDGTI